MGKTKTLHTVEVALNSSGRVLVIGLVVFVAACGSGSPGNGPGSTAGSSKDSTITPSQLSTSETTIPATAGSTVPSTSLYGAGSTTTGSVALQDVLPSFVATWNRMALNQGRDEWVIELLPVSPPSSPENTYGWQWDLGGEPPQLVVDAVATGGRLARLEVAVLRLDESSVELVEDAFRIGVMTALSVDDPTQVDDFVAELVERAMLSPPDPAENVVLPGGAIAGSFSTDMVHVLGISWPSE